MPSITPNSHRSMATHVHFPITTRALSQSDTVTTRCNDTTAVNRRTCSQRLVSRFCSRETLNTHPDSTAIYAKDEETAANIMATNRPVTMKRLARGIKNFNGHTWDKISRCFMQQLSWAKVRVFESSRHAMIFLFLQYSQNKHLRELLFNTIGTELAECSPRDCRWGVGLSLRNKRVHNRCAR